MSTQDTSGMAYWKANVRLIIISLIIWAICSFGFGILLRDALDAMVPFGKGFGLGFWFAQQGSMIVFLILTFNYAYQMNKLDIQFDVHED